VIRAREQLTHSMMCRKLTECTGVRAAGDPSWCEEGEGNSSRDATDQSVFGVRLLIALMQNNSGKK
jgi:hypothetical protein